MVAFAEFQFRMVTPLRVRKSWELAQPR